MTVTDKDVFLAILAMDSYNRGYGAGLNDNGAGDGDGLGDAIGSGIGSATILSVSSSAPTGAEVAAGFYAVAYSTPYGTVISYRGAGFTPASEFSTDVFHCWARGRAARMPRLIKAASL